MTSDYPTIGPLGISHDLLTRFIGFAYLVDLGYIITRILPCSCVFCVFQQRSERSAVDNIASA